MLLLYESLSSSGSTGGLTYSPREQLAIKRSSLHFCPLSQPLPQKGQEISIKNNLQSRNLAHTGLWTCGDIAVNRQRQPVPEAQTEKLCPNDTKGQD